MRSEKTELQVKQIAISSILSIGAAVVGFTTVWAFLQSQFAPNRLTEYKITEQSQHIERLETKLDEMHSENHELRIWFEQLKSKQ